MKLFNRENSFESWLKTATDQELSEEYEKRRQEWMKNGQNGTGIKTPEMQKIDHEMILRFNEKMKKESYRNTDPNYRWTDANRWE